MYTIKTGLFFFVITTQFLLAQIGIGTNTPNNSAALELNSSNLPANNKKGFLLPRIALQNNTDVITIPNPAVGLTIYNTTDNGSGASAVSSNTYYYWNGINWVNLSTITEVKRELLPQIFFLAEGNNGITTPQNPISGADNVNTSPVLVNFSASSIVLNTNNNISPLDKNNFKVNTSGNYEISGYIGYNPQISLLTSTTNMEFTIQISTDNGTNWSSIAKTVGVWGNGLTGNNRTNNIAPTVVSFNQNDMIRCTVYKTVGANHGNGATISAATGLNYGKVLKIQKLN